MSDMSALRALIDLRDRTLQKNRIAFGLRIGAVERGSDTAGEETSQMYERWQERFREMETECDKEIKSMAKEYPIIERMTKLKGVGVTLAAKVAAMIDIERADTVSALWRYAGYAAIDGERERPKKGEPLHYNVRLKTSCYLIGESFLRSNSPYRRVYDDAKAYYQANRPEWTKGHIHAASMRKMIKVFLSHLWIIWREMEDLPIRSLYVNDRLAHQHYYGPAEFGWEASEADQGF